MEGALLWFLGARLWFLGGSLSVSGLCLQLSGILEASSMFAFASANKVIGLLDVLWNVEGGLSGASWRQF